MTWTPEASFDEVHDARPMGYVRSHLGDEVCKLLDLLDGGTASDDRLLVGRRTRRLSAYFDRQKVMPHRDGYTNPVTARVEPGYVAKPAVCTAVLEAGPRLTEHDRKPGSCTPRDPDRGGP